jgi:ABC-type dipeptide/oligopeptide/nickel transport system permease component
VRGSLTDRAVMIACTVGMSISILVYIIVFQYGLAYKLGLFPVQGWGESFGENLLRYSLLPILIGLAVSIAPTLRLFRSSCWTRRARTTCAPRAPRVCRSAASSGCTCCATPPSRSSRT